MVQVGDCRLFLLRQTALVFLNRCINDHSLKNENVKFVIAAKFGC